MLIYVNEHVPFVEGIGRITERKGTLEHCSARLYPNYSYEQGLEITGVYRPPNIPNQKYEEELTGILAPNRKENVSIIIAGDLNVNTWGKGYENWLEEENIWVLANPEEPTHESGTTDDTMLFVAGDYIPEGILPGEAETDKALQTEDCYPVHTTEKNVIRDHMVQTLTLQTVRPDARSDCKRYNVRGMSKKDWEAQQTTLVALQDYRDMQK